MAMGAALTAPFVEDEEPFASAAALLDGADGTDGVPMVVNSGAAVSGSGGDDVISGRAVSCCVKAAAAFSVVAAAAAVGAAVAVFRLSV